MNALPATITDPKSVAAWIMPAMLYAAASDRLIAVVRGHALAQAPESADQRSPYQALGGADLWLLRLALAPPSTYTAFRRWVIAVAPAAPGLPTNPQPAPAQPPPHPQAPAPSQPRAMHEPAPHTHIHHGPTPPGGASAAPHPARITPGNALDHDSHPRWATPKGHQLPQTIGTVPSHAWPGSPAATVPTAAQMNGSTGTATGNTAGHTGDGESKRARLIRLYDAAGAAGDPATTPAKASAPWPKNSTSKPASRAPPPPATTSTTSSTNATYPAAQPRETPQPKPTQTRPQPPPALPRTKPQRHTTPPTKTTPVVPRPPTTLSAAAHTTTRTSKPCRPQPRVDPLHSRT
jgi:hypothetical protein